MLKVTLGLALVTLVACSQCPNNEVCEAGQTCCQDPTGEFSCCPFHNGECCEDHLHCCPEYMLCSVTDSICENATLAMPFVKRIPAKQTDHPKSFRMIPSLPASENDITCPDGSFCPAEFSCLLMASSYGCCPVAQGLVCSDGKHCCPKDHECSADSKSCVKLKEPVKTVLCGNGISECPVDTTCCEAEDGQWACCPVPKAVCCDDKIHCCPEDSVCDVEASKCMSSTNQELPMWDKFPARLRAEWEDHKPAEMRAEAELTTTRQITTAGNQMTSLPGVLPKTSDVPCNDTAACPDGSTCCKTKEGEWACCPLPQAVCCDDFIHCCPHDTTCNTAAGSCDDSSGSQLWFEKLPVKTISSQDGAVTQVTSVHSDVPCNDTAACPDGSTCCKTKEGGWACCPLPQAVCCDDFIHCCPHDTTCNTAAGSCDDSSGSQLWFEKLPVKTISSQDGAVTQVTSVHSDVPCNDTAACPDGSTCCKTKEGGWACCPLPQAVCCDDFIHCCPHDTTCNTAAGSCDDSSGSQLWFKKLPAFTRADQRSPAKVNCDSSHICPDSSTCCKNIDGEWGCCPLPEAVCCKDKFHCCPHDTTCDFVTLSCTSNTTSVPMSVIKQPSAKEEQRQHGEVKDRVGKYNSRIPCDSQTSCPDYTTCCFIAKSNKWGCCPLPNAVCCKDGEHCCPTNYKCDVIKVSCIKGDVVIPWYNKLSAQSTPTPSLDLGTVECDEQSSCSADSTCCYLSTGEWGCCPFPEAVCCPDQEHCCPGGYRCDLRRRSCIKTTWLHVEIVPLSHIDDQNPQSTVSKDIQCGGGYSCKDSDTCCPTSETTWGCCPSPQAECCDDMKHCCPAGYKCGAGGTCTLAVGFDWRNWDNWRVFFSKSKQAIKL
ncbi:granulin a isoform X10 [Puntigrus tetrazona]|uniref:granulin a isoform X10 n=1 Tax=Puntigrus tetrazona TaxID=1606681 RepID=UPI001C8965CC|nr:granulin a isoform X10 [Puntigrus tetrazona]